MELQVFQTFNVANRLFGKHNQKNIMKIVNLKFTEEITISGT